MENFIEIGPDICASAGISGLFSAIILYNHQAEAYSIFE